MSKLTELYAKRDREKAKADYLALPKAPRSLDSAPGFSGKLGQAVTARNKREFNQSAREQQARRKEQWFGAEQAQGQARAAAGAQLGMQGVMGQQEIAKQRLSGDQRLAEIKASGEQSIASQQGKPKALGAKSLPGAMTAKQKADVTSNLRKQYYGKELGKGLQERYGEKGLAKRGQSGFSLYLRDEMQKYQPIQLPQPTQAVTQPDTLQQLPGANGAMSFTTTGTQAQPVPSFGQQPIQQPAAVSPFAQQAGAVLPQQIEQPAGIVQSPLMEAPQIEQPPWRDPIGLSRKGRRDFNKGRGGYDVRPDVKGFAKKIFEPTGPNPRGLTRSARKRRKELY